MFNALNGQSGSDALENATKAALPYDFEGTARAPKGQGDLASSTAATIQNGLQGADLTPVKGGAGMSDADRQGAYVAAIKRGATWVNNERGDGWTMAIRANDGSYQFPLRQDSTRIGFKFADMGKGTSAPIVSPPAFSPEGT
jgi:hypothetical protein